MIKCQVKSIVDLFIICYIYIYIYIYIYFNNHTLFNHHKYIVYICITIKKKHELIDSYKYTINKSTKEKKNSKVYRQLGALNRTKVSDVRIVYFKFIFQKSQITAKTKRVFSFSCNINVLFGYK